MTSSRYVKGYAVDFEKVARVLGFEHNDRRVDHAIIDLVSSIRTQSHSSGNTHSFSTARYLVPKDESKRVFMVISMGLESFSDNSEELKDRTLQFPDYLRLLAEHFFTGPDVFEILNSNDPLISQPESSLAYASYLGFC